MTTSTPKNLTEALTVLRNGAKHNPRAVMAWAYHLTHVNPDDAPMIAAIIAAVFLT